MTTAGLLTSAAAAAIASLAASVLTLAGLRRGMVLDTPNERSSHTRPIPRGGGLGFMVVIVVSWTALWLTGSTSVTPAIIGGAVAIGAVSFVDDLQHVSFGIRLAVQTIAVFAALVWFPSGKPILADFVPLAVDRIIVGLMWLWFINLFNFMDGIDGLAAGEAVIVAFGLMVIAAVSPTVGPVSPEALVAGAAVLAFLPFNLSPARMFMGDVGSVGLGYLLGWLLIIAASKGALISALLLPLYFVADASTTLARRVWKRKPLAQAHRDHAYQNAVDTGLSHTLVTSMVVALGLLLIALAVLAVSMPIIAFGLGLLLTAAFVAWLRLH